MPVKRSRIGKSSSFGEPDLLNHVSSPVESAERREIRTAPPSASLKPPHNPTKVLKPSVSDNTDQSQPRVLTLASPVQESVDAIDKEQLGGFLEKCYYCKKKIRQDKEVFMYGYLRAFCSAECRDGQISLEKDPEKEFAKSEQKVAQRCEMNNLKGQLGF